MSPGRREAKGNDLDRQWKRAEPWHELGRIGDDDHALRGGGDTADVETRFDPFAHEIDELARGRAAAEPELHPWHNQLKRPLRGLPLSLVPVRHRGHALNCFRSLNAAARPRARKPRGLREKPLYRLARTKANPIPLMGPLIFAPRRARPRTSASPWWAR